MSRLQRLLSVSQCATFLLWRSDSSELKYRPDDKGAEYYLDIFFSKMFSNSLASITFFVIVRLIRSETSKEPLQDVSPKSTLKSNLDDIPTYTWDGNPNLNSMWVHRPSSRQSKKEQDNEFEAVYLKGPLSVPRLAKPFTYGFDPYFKKGYFEPFERRQRPVTLVAFRRNGLLPRRSVKVADIQSADVAELQSPFNEVSSFWRNEPDLINE